jgi:thermitase
MFKKILISGLLLITTLVHSQGYVKESVLVSPKAGVSAEGFNSILKQAGGHSSKRLGALNVYEIKVPSGAETAVVTALGHNPNIKFAELNKTFKVDYTPNDPYFLNGWHLAKMNVPQMWDLSQGSGIVVAVADTGVFIAHPDLAANMLPGGFNVAENNTDITDYYGHGTLVSGTIAAITNNGVGASSMSPLVKILPIKIVVGSENLSSWSSMALAINYAADHGARVINTSFGGAGNAATIQTAAAYMVSKGGIVVWSAGNDNADFGYYDNPNIIIVSATDSNDVRASWSSFGNYVDVAAPGVSILTTTNSGGYSYASGTSFSSPIVAGVVAAMLSANPNLSNTQVDQILKSTAVDLGTAGEDVYYGAGRVDALAAVQLALATIAIDNINPTVQITNVLGGSTLRDSIVVNTTATDNNSVSKVVLKLGNTVVGTETVVPYSFVLDTTGYSNGSYNLSATAYDQAGNAAISTVPVYLANNDFYGPSISITAPTAGSTLSGKKPIKITSYSVDESGTPVTQKLYIDNVLTTTVTGSNLTYNWNISKVTSGSHVLKIISTDVSNNSSTAAITVVK